MRPVVKIQRRNRRSRDGSEISSRCNRFRNGIAVTAIHIGVSIGEPIGACHGYCGRTIDSAAAGPDNHYPIFVKRCYR